MGRISLPDITKVEEVLDLVTNQDKYAGYLKALVDASAAAKTALGDLQTKDAADLYLAQAKEKFDNAVKYADKVSKDSAVVLANVAVAEAALKEKQEIFHQSAVKRGDVQDQEERALLAAQATFEHSNKVTEKLLIERERVLLDGQAKLAEETKAFLAKRAKFENALKA